MHINLQKHDRICFLGDSITANGSWIAEIYEHFIENYPELRTGFFNCGISGTRGGEAGIKNRLYCDCFDLSPKYLAVMFGMNDSMTHLYNPSCTEPDKAEKKKAAIEKYKKGILEVVNECSKNGITPIILAPTPYDEYTISGTDNNMADAALLRCGEIASEIACQNGLIFVNMHSALMKHMGKKPVGEDRIHPNAFGHHLMAEEFLHSIGAKEKTEPDKKIILSEKNKKRYETEQIYRHIMFVERDYMLWQYGDSPALEERKRLLFERVKSETAEWIGEILDTYLKYADYKDEIRGELVRLSKEIYN